MCRLTGRSLHQGQAAKRGCETEDRGMLLPDARSAPVACHVSIKIPDGPCRFLGGGAGGGGGVQARGG